MIPIDITDKIDELYINSIENSEVKNIIESLYKKKLNVGNDQLIRSLLILSEGKINKLKSFCDGDLYEDPRDIIMLAERMVGNPGHFFIPTFKEIENGK